MSDTTPLTLDQAKQMHQAFAKLSTSISFTFLIVDESPTMRRSVRQLVESSGFYDTMEAKDGLEASTMHAQIDGHCVVILDLKLKGMNGMQLLKSIKKSGRPFTTCVISSVADKEQLKYCVNELGVTCFQIKPMNGEKVTEFLQALYNK